MHSKTAKKSSRKNARKTHKGKGTQKLKKGIIKVFDKWFDCSHFED